MTQGVCAAIYARVSSELQAKQKTIASQIAALENRVKKDGLILTETTRFIDEGVSGSSLIRPALENLRDAAYNGLIDRLYVLSPDRLARRYAYQVLLIEELMGAGIEIVFLDHSHGTSAEENLLLQMQGMIAEYERAKIIERHRRGKLHHAKHGNVSVLSGAPYGYHYIPKQRDGAPARYEINFTEAKVVRKIFDWIGLDRLSIGEVVRRLQNEGVKTKTGKSNWDRSVIWGLLQNPAYMGKAAFGKTKSGQLLPRIRPQKHSSETPKNGYSIYRQAKEDWIEIAVPALVSEGAFQAVQEQLEENRKRSRQRRRGAAYLLQGLVVCGHCQYAYYGKPVSPGSARGKPRYAYYRCIGTDAYRFGGQRLCDNKQLRTTALDEVVWNQVRTVLKDPHRLEKEYYRRLDDYEQKQAAQFDPTGLEKQVVKLRQGASRLIDSYTEGLIERDEFEPRIKNLKARIAQAENQLKEFNKVQATQFELCLVVNHLEQFANSVKAKLEDIEFHTRREIIRSMVKRVEIYKDEVVVVFRIEPAGSTGTGGNGTENNSGKSHFMQDCKWGNNSSLRCSCIS